MKYAVMLILCSVQLTNVGALNITNINVPVSSQLNINGASTIVLSSGSIGANSVITSSSYTSESVSNLIISSNVSVIFNGGSANISSTTLGSASVVTLNGVTSANINNVNAGT